MTPTLKNTSKKTKSKSASNVSDPRDVERLLEQAKLDLLSLISHELRTPLTGILNSVRLLQEDGISKEDQKKFLEIAARNAERLNLALNQVLDLSKMVSGQLICRFHEAPLENIARAAVDRLRQTCADRGIPFVARQDAQVLPSIVADSARLVQVFESICENAVKFCALDGKIQFHASVQDSFDSVPSELKSSSLNRHASAYVVVQLSNSVRPGTVAPEHDVFQVFAQQENVLDRLHEGVGGSLALAAEILRQHSGRLFASVADDVFSVWMVLPVLKNQHALNKILEARMTALKNEVGALSIVVLQSSAKSLTPLQKGLNAALFRASDSIYILPDTNELVVLMDDCKKEDAPKLLNRLLEGLGEKAKALLKDSRVGFATSPKDGTLPGDLLRCAREAAVPLEGASKS